MQNRQFLRPRNLSLECLDARRLLSCRDELCAADTDVQPVKAVEAQYAVHHPPRLQLGNAPLIGTADYDGLDQVDIIWQTVTVGDGTSDAFTVEYRSADSSHWNRSIVNEPIDTDFETRIMHSATIRGLQWDAAYVYRVRHVSGAQIVETFESDFRTRLSPGDQQPFSFAAYGDSATLRSVDAFRFVQSQITAQEADFAVLLGDNFYTRGSHAASDSRFDPDLSPEAIEWNRSHIDFFGVGNNDISTAEGQPSRDLFSVPIPNPQNSPFEPPVDEFAEHNYSFDYGNVHFVTFDSNPVAGFLDPDRMARVNELLDYAAADLEASDAKWKIVFVHHPFIGTEKTQIDDLYQTRVLDSLNRAGADLFLTGHSHSFSWTHSLSGFTDENDDGMISPEEVEFVVDTDRVFDKGTGIVQLVSGVGGNSLRFTTYDEPFVAAGYSLDESTGPLEYGFAKVEVTQRELRVSYISGSTGRIVGDTNGNGLADPDEPYFGQFRIVDFSIPDPDLNRDGILTASDIDALQQAVRDAESEERFDINQDGGVSSEDVCHLLTFHLDTTYGDSNLDGVFDSTDLTLVAQSGEYDDTKRSNSTWADGDWNGDGEFTSRDLVLAFQSGRYVTD